jgi:hypothetical protein
LLVLAVSGGGRRVRGFGGAAVFGVDALGLFELVFEDDDAAGGLDGVPWSTSSRARAAMRSW